MRVLICCCRFAPVIVVIGGIKPASTTAVAAQDDVDVTTTRVGSGPSTVQKSAMDGSSGIAIFGMGHNAHPGLLERGSVLQSMLQFATKSKETKEGRNLTKTHKGDAGAMGNAGEREGSKRNREASGAGERASGRTGNTGQRDKEQIEEAQEQGRLGQSALAQAFLGQEFGKESLQAQSLPRRREEQIQEAEETEEAYSCRWWSQQAPCPGEEANERSVGTSEEQRLETTSEGKVSGEVLRSINLGFKEFEEEKIERDSGKRGGTVGPGDAGLNVGGSFHLG